MPRSYCAATAALLVSLCLPSNAQQGTALRTGLGTSLGPAGDGTPQYREDSGWSSSNFNQPRWALEYGGTLSASPWIVVYQGDRTNAAFTAGANQLVLDLAGRTHNISAYFDGSVRGGPVIISDRLGTGAFLRVKNGSFLNVVGGTARTTVGETGKVGRLFVEDGLYRSNRIDVGTASGAEGVVVLDSGGQLTAVADLFVGTSGTGRIELRGAGSVLTSARIDIGQPQGDGSILVAHDSALVQVTGDVLITNAGGSTKGLHIQNGAAHIGGNLRLATPTGSSAVTSVEGGVLRVDGNVAFGPDATDTTGGKLYLRGGRLEVASPAALAPAANKQFYWENGELAFRATDVTLTSSRLGDYTRQGALSYGGGRAAGSLADGQTLEAAGKLTLSGGAFGLAGGTIRAGTELAVGAPIEGHGTLDALVTGVGSITNTTANALSIGALGGSNAIVSAGELRVGGRNLNATFAGASSGAGAFAKIGTGTQSITGTVSNARVEGREGTLTFDGAGLRLNTLSGEVTAGARMQFVNGATGSVSGVFTNNGWIELTAGALDVGGTLVNHGTLINNGALDAVVTGGGMLSGAGSFSGPVTIASGATLAPGNSPGTATFADLTLGPDGSFELELAAANGVAGSDWDLASVTGLLSIAATAANPYVVVIKSLDASLAAGALTEFDADQAFTWQFVSGTISNPQAIDLSAFRVDASDFIARNGPVSGTFGVTASASGLSVSYVQPAAVPEPGSALLLVMAGCTAAGVTVRARSRRGLARSDRAKL